MVKMLLSFFVLYNIKRYILQSSNAHDQVSRKGFQELINIGLRNTGVVMYCNAVDFSLED